MTGGRPFTDDDDRLVVLLFQRGYGNSFIGETLKRSHNSIARRLSHLGLTRNAPEHRPEATIEMTSFVLQSPEEKWAAASKEHHGERQYQDVKFKKPQSEILEPKRDYGANHMTMGGVAAY